MLGYPGIFRGALLAGATEINVEMKRAAAWALAGLTVESELVPDVLDPEVHEAVAEAVQRGERHAARRPYASRAKPGQTRSRCSRLVAEAGEAVALGLALGLALFLAAALALLLLLVAGADDADVRADAAAGAEALEVLAGDAVLARSPRAAAAVAPRPPRPPSRRGPPRPRPRAVVATPRSGRPSSLLIAETGVAARRTQAPKTGRRA